MLLVWEWQGPFDFLFLGELHFGLQAKVSISSRARKILSWSCQCDRGFGPFTLVAEPVGSDYKSCKNLDPGRCESAGS